MTTNLPKPTVLIILDGWGHREETEYNAIAAANTPTWDTLWSNYPHMLISGSGVDVGLPTGQMGNSEVGHTNFGAGRVVYQDLTRINCAIEQGDFFHNAIIVNSLEKLKQSGKALHILGLLSSGGIHSHEKHIHAMCELAAQHDIKSVYVHAFLDGRDTPPQSAQASISSMEATLRSLNMPPIASIIGRYYAMDRDQRWDRVQAAYDLITTGEAQFHAATAFDGLAMAYDRGEYDEFVQATSIHGSADNPVIIDEGDSVIFMNFRADRARQITRAFVEKNFHHFKRKLAPCLTDFVMLTEYAADIPAASAYPPEHIENDLGQYLSSLNKTQLRIAETEKYAHVTFFFNGGREQPYEGEDRVLVSSPHVATYNLQPEMSAFELTDKLVQAITDQKYDFIVCNYANPDMVGHTGDFNAAIKAVETVDQCLDKVINAIQSVGGDCLITADHGNVENMFDVVTQQNHTAHTSELVPFIYVGNKKLSFNTDHGVLSDVAPTVLALMSLPKPREMTGRSLITLS